MKPELKRLLVFVGALVVLVVAMGFLGRALGMEAVAARTGPRYVWVSQERANYTQVQDFLTAIGPLAIDAKVVTEFKGHVANIMYRIYYRVEAAEKAEKP